MNAKMETLRPSSAWEALPLRSSLGSPAWKPWEKTQETRPLSLAGPAPFVGRRGDELSPAGVWRRKPLHLGVSVRTRRVVPPQWCYGIAPVHHGGSWRTPASCPSQECLHTGPGATDKAGKVFPARGVMVPLFEVAGRIEPPPLEASW